MERDQFVTLYKGLMRFRLSLMGRAQLEEQYSDLDLDLDLAKGKSDEQLRTSIEESFVSDLEESDESWVGDLEAQKEYVLAVSEDILNGQ